MTDFLFDKRDFVGQLIQIKRDMASLKAKPIKVGKKFWNLFQNLPIGDLPAANTNYPFFGADSIKIELNPNFPDNLLVVDDLMCFWEGDILTVHKIPKSVII